MSQYEVMPAYDPMKIVMGRMALDGTNPTPIVTGLREILAVVLTYEDATAPGDDYSTLTYAVSGGTVNVYAWEYTSGTDATLVASNATDTFSFVIFGRE